MTYKHDTVHPVKHEVYKEEGITKREYFAAMALQGFSTFSYVSPERAAKNAVEYADALIKELNK